MTDPKVLNGGVNNPCFLFPQFILCLEIKYIKIVFKIVIDVV